jgi:hypothetical protein
MHGLVFGIDNLLLYIDGPGVAGRLLAGKTKKTLLYSAV